MPTPCQKCGADLPSGVRFCLACGIPVADQAEPETAASHTCPQCGHANKASDRFCNQCGADLRAAAVRPADPDESLTQQMHSQRTPFPPEPPPPSTEAMSDWPAPQPEGAMGWSPPRRGLGTMSIVVITLAVLLAGGVAAGVIVLVTHKSSTPQIPPAAAFTETTTTTESTTSTESTESTPTQTTESKGVLPAESTEQMQASIQQVLYNWHEDVVNGDSHGAWDLLSERKRQQNLKKEGYSTWAKNQATLKPYLNPSGIKVSIEGAPNEQTGEATVNVTGMTWSAPGAKCSEWSGITWVIYKNGSWHYDPGYSTTPQREGEYKSRYKELLGGSC